jgi:hypothetical protein
MYPILARIRGVTPVFVALRSSEVKLKSGINSSHCGPTRHLFRFELELASAPR